MTTDPEPETVTVTLPRDVVEAAWERLIIAARNTRVGEKVFLAHYEAADGLRDALDAANGSQPDNQDERVAQGAGGAERAVGGESGAALIAAERNRQIEKGYTPEHDAQHSDGEFLDAAQAYLLRALGWRSRALDSWPRHWGRPPSIFATPVGLTTPMRRDLLVKAGALIAAAIDRSQS